MTDLDRDDAEAANALAQHLRGRLAAGIDPHFVAGHLITLIREHGWRPIPRPPAITGGARGDPPNTDWRKAREQLTRTEGDTDA